MPQGFPNPKTPQRDPAPTERSRRDVGANYSLGTPSRRAAKGNFIASGETASGPWLRSLTVKVAKNPLICDCPAYFPW